MLYFKISEENWSGVFWQFVNRWIPNGYKTIKIKPPTLTSSDVLQAIKSLSSTFKDALQQSKDQGFIMLPKVLPHLKEAVEVTNRFAILNLSKPFDSLPHFLLNNLLS